jgi:viroplasmin and RNaseH domain-containing protein
MKWNWYVVYYGKKPRVYDSWEKCNEQVDGYENNCYKGYKTKKEAGDRYPDFVHKEKINYEVCKTMWTSKEFDYIYPIHCHYGVVVIMRSCMYVTYWRLR